jgi:hypothetical protein
MRLRKTMWMMAVLLALAGICASANGQNGNGHGNSKRKFDRIPDVYGLQLGALGRRAREAGKEKTIYAGQLFDKRGHAASVKITHQLPNLVRLEGFKNGNAAISYDGQRGYGATSQQEDSYLETFATDMAEGMLTSIQSNVAVRFLGSGFGPDPLKVPNYTGPRFDIFQIIDTVRCRREQVRRSKLYCFDSKTGLLERTRYKNRSVRPAVEIETRFSVWGTIEGSAYPAKIEHYEGGELAFTFIAEQIAAESESDVESFR